MRLAASILLIAMLCACGQPGAPQPPSLEVPRPVTDLRAQRRGDRVVLTWTVPTRTTDRQPVRHIGQTRICRVTNAAVFAAAAKLPDAALMNGCSEVTRVTPQLTAGRDGRQQASFEDTRPQGNDAGSAIYAIEVLNDRGRGAGVSNQVAVPLAPTLPAPAGVEAAVSATGIDVRWQGERARPQVGVRYQYRVTRAESGAQRPEAADVGVVPLNESGAYSLHDGSAEWEKRYQYTVTPETIVDGSAPITVAGASAQSAAVLVHDAFPPATPSGVQAVFTEAAGERFIDITWTPNQEPDIAGYNLYRREEGGTPTKINADLLRAPATRDANVAAGRTYLYSVSAVDLRGNESARSPETSERVPQ